MRARFKYGDSKPETVRHRIASGLAGRREARDSGALAMRPRRMPGP